MVSVPAGRPWLDKRNITAHTASGNGVHCVCVTVVTVQSSMSSAIYK